MCNINFNPQYNKRTARYAHLGKIKQCGNVTTEICQICWLIFKQNYVLNTTEWKAAKHDNI